MSFIKPLNYLNHYHREYKDKIFSEKVDFNEAYRLGYDRVGCWCCPNNNQRAQFLSKIYMPEKYKEWRNFLISFAKKIGKPDPETYVDEGGLKARQGGNGLPAAGDVKIKFTNCTAEEHAKIYRLVRPFDDELVGMFVPFGKVAPELGQKLLGEVIILDCRTKVVINYNYTNTAEKYYRILGKNPEIIYINGSLTVPYKIRTEEVDASIVIGYSNSKESLVPREAFLLKKDLDEL